MVSVRAFRVPMHYQSTNTSVTFNDVVLRSYHTSAVVVGPGTQRCRATCHLIWEHMG